MHTGKRYSLGCSNLTTDMESGYLDCWNGWSAWRDLPLAEWVCLGLGRSVQTSMESDAQRNNATKPGRMNIWYKTYQSSTGGLRQSLLHTPNLYPYLTLMTSWPGNTGSQDHDSEGGSLWHLLWLTVTAWQTLRTVKDKSYYCVINTVRWAWLDWGLFGWLTTTLLQCFDTVGWVIRPVKPSAV